MIYVPNLITLLRIVCVPFLVILIFNQSYGYALVLFLCAGVSDAFDGYIAKRFNCITKLGKILDPIADKCLLVAVFVVLAYHMHIPFWLAAIVVFRDLVIIFGVVFISVLLGGIELKPLWVSKLNTVLQALLVTAVLFNLTSLSFLPRLEVETLYIVVAASSVLSGIAHIYQGLQLAAHNELHQLFKS